MYIQILIHGARGARRAEAVKACRAAGFQVFDGYCIFNGETHIGQIEPSGTIALGRGLPHAQHFAERIIQAEEPNSSLDLAQPLSLAHIQADLDAIRASAEDDEVAHSLEDTLHERVLQAIADDQFDHYYTPAELAREALKSTEIKFSRWCA